MKIKLFDTVILKFCLLGALDRFMLIYSVYIMFFAKIGLTPSLIGLVLATYEIGKIAGDPVFATLADKYGRKVMIILGFVFKAIGVMSWILYPGFATAVLGALLIGSGKAGTNTIDSYMYDEFKSNGIEGNFKNAIAMKSIITNLSASVGGYISSILYLNFGFDGVFLMSAFIIIFVSIPYIAVFLKDAKSYSRSNRNISIFKVAVNGGKILRNNSKILYAIVLSAIFYSAYIIYTDTNKMIMNDIGFKPDVIAKIYAVAHIVPAVTTLIFLIFRPGILIRGVIVLASSIWVGIMVTANIMYGKALIATILVYLFMFPIFDTCIRDNLHRLIPDSSARATILSFSHLISSGINIISSLLIGFIAQHKSYGVAISVFSAIIVVVTIVIMSMHRISVVKKYRLVS